MRKVYIIITITIVFFDQLTKLLIIKNFNQYDSISVLPFVKIIYVKNTGAAFGILQNLGNNVFIVISIIAIIGIFYVFLKSSDNMFSFSLLLGGATGNLIDRFIRGYVIDFIDIFVGKYHWPAFNIADSSLTIGIFLLIISQFRQVKNLEEKK